MTLNERMETIASNPIFFERNRVFRVYRGGRLYHDFFGDPEKDDNFPEEWISSCVRALNGNSANDYTGVSVIRDENILLSDLISQQKKMMINNRQDLGILVKTIDSAIRLPIQTHPSRCLAKELFQSNYGKAEMWIVLATRENACVYYGFKKRMSETRFLSFLSHSHDDPSRVEKYLNRIEVQQGDVFFVPPGMVHAIGEGCMILEVQEPTDLTIQPETRCGNYELNEYERFLGLSHEQMIRCFDFSIFGEAALMIGRRHPIPIEYSNGCYSVALTNIQDVLYFDVRRHTIERGRLENMEAPGIFIVIEGNGCLRTNTGERDISKGDYFFLPYSIRKQCVLESQERCVVIECRPPVSST